MILRRWGRRGKGDLSRFSAAELGMVIWGRCGSGGVVPWQPACCPRSSGSSVSRACLLGLVAETKPHLGGRMLERESLWDPQEMGTDGQGKWPQVFCCRAGDEFEDWNLENK